MNYNHDSIVSLGAGRAFREKLGMYLSADKQEAINLGLRELIVNVQDEFEVYKPKDPTLTISLNTKLREIVVEDNMRGIPCGVRTDGMNSLTAAFMIPHSGGKHSEGAYSSAIGINGEGAKIVNHTAAFLEVQVKREGKIHFQRFESNDEGASPVTEVEIKGNTNETGTMIKYVPDAKVYGDAFINIETLKEMLKEMSYFTKGLKIILSVDEEYVITFFSKNGLIDGLSGQNPLSKPLHFLYETEDCKVELALQWVTKGGQIKGYANGLHMRDGGAFMSGFKSSLTRSFNSLMKKKFGGDQIRSMLDGFVSVKVRMGEFSNQAKTALANAEARTATSAAISQLLKEYYESNQSVLNTVAEILTKYEKAEKAAEKAREEVLNINKEIGKKRKQKIVASDKLKDAEVLGQDSILLVVEGDSAGQAALLARDTKKYGVLMAQGKFLNSCEKEEEKVLKNKIVERLILALGLNVGNYNPKTLRYGKVGIFVDADDDGSHIALLIIAAIFRICPELIKENRLMWLKAPLFSKLSKGKKKYFYTQEELDADDSVGTILRYKGIGSMNSEDMEASMFSPEFQRMETLEYNEEFDELFNSLMGKDVAFRKEYVSENIDFSE